jgi:maleate isomerase
MEPELHAMAPPGVTIHTARLRLAQAAIRSPEEARAAVAAMQSGLEVAIRDVTSAAPDHLMIGVSALSFMNGLAGRQRFEEFLARVTSVPVTTAAAATTGALHHYGGKEARLVVAASDDDGRALCALLHGSGIRGRQAASHRLPDDDRDRHGRPDENTYRLDLCDAGAQAVVQLGTDLVMVQLADEAERWLGRPVLAVNAAMLWHALRARGIQDRLPGFGSLLREH